MTTITPENAGKLINDIYSDYIQKVTNTNNAVSSNKRVLFLNENYRKKQYEYNLLFFYVFIAIVIFCILVAIKYFFPFISSTIINFLIILVFFLTFIYVVYKFYDIQRRYVLNFDEIDTNTDIEYANGESEDKKDILSGSSILGYDLYECRSQACCPEKTIYDKNYRKCIPDVNGNYFAANSGNYANAGSVPTYASAGTTATGPLSQSYEYNSAKYYYIPSINNFMADKSETNYNVVNTLYTSSSITDRTNPVMYITTENNCSGGDLVKCGKVCVHKNKCPNPTDTSN